MNIVFTRTVKNYSIEIMIKNGKETIIILNGRTYHCPLGVTMSYIGGKWRATIIWYLRDGAHRFSQLRKRIPEITEKMLSIELKKLEHTGIVQRTVHPEVPPRVEYTLTKDGKTLLPAVGVLATWGLNRGKKQGKIQQVSTQ